MKLSHQFSFPYPLPVDVKNTLQLMWEEIARAHNSHIQPRLVTDSGNPPTEVPEMEQYEIIFFNAPNWDGGKRYLIYFDGVVRHYFLRDGADLI